MTLFLDCTCSTFIDEKGFGMCETRHELMNGRPNPLPRGCYVNEPSSCSDLRNNTLTKQSSKHIASGRQYSYEACLGINVFHNKLYLSILKTLTLSSSLFKDRKYYRIV